MSLLLWAGGQNWWNNVGYWPYGVEGREAAESWDGSNAPHLVGESFVSPRTTRLVSSGWSDKLDVLELDRTSGRNFYIAHRQVIHWKPDLWVVLDSTFGQAQSFTRSIWTTASDVRWEREHTDGSFVFETASSNDRMNVFFFGSPGMTQKLLRGSYHPFAGWQVEGGTPVPSFSLVTEQPANNSWAATVWTWERGDGNSRFAEQPQMANWTNAADWEMRVPRADGSATLRRKGDTLELRDDRGIQETMRLTSPPDSSSRLAELHDQFSQCGRAISSLLPRFLETAKSYLAAWRSIPASTALLRGVQASSCAGTRCTQMAQPDHLDCGRILACRYLFLSRDRLELSLPLLVGFIAQSPSGLSAHRALKPWDQVRRIRPPALAALKPRTDPQHACVRSRRHR